jgi:hypothetical protein
VEQHMLDVVELFMAMNADFNVKDKLGRTALMHVSQWPRLKSYPETKSSRELVRTEHQGL